MIYDAIGRTLAVLLVALILPGILAVFMLVCIVAMVKTLFEKPNDPEFWE